MNEKTIINGVRVVMIVIFTLAGIGFLDSSDSKSLEVFFGFVLIGFACLFFLIGEKGRN